VITGGHLEQNAAFDPLAGELARAAQLAQHAEVISGIVGDTKLAADSSESLVIANS
jgi:hypothetical protein